ncbi:hypothetical protein LI328DRAFT_128805 [Trichoderma asperelloides]|nr:hypothetical protein LI328DRAFT_128805 [Trichoderma asperelloides]
MRKIGSLLFLLSFFLLPAVASICAGTMPYCESLCNICKQTILSHGSSNKGRNAPFGGVISASFSGWPCSSSG